MMFDIKVFWSGEVAVRNIFADKAEAASYYAMRKREEAFIASETLSKKYVHVCWPYCCKNLVLVEYNGKSKDPAKILADGTVVPIAELHEQITVARREGKAIETTAWEQMLAAERAARSERRRASEEARPHRRWDSLCNNRGYASTGRHAYKAAMVTPIEEDDECATYNVRIKPLRRKPLERDRTSVFQSNWKSASKSKRQYLKKAHQDTLTVNKRSVFDDADYFDDCEIDLAEMVVE